MREREDYPLFIVETWAKSGVRMFEVYDLIMDTTGKLARLAVEWVEGKK